MLLIDTYVSLAFKAAYYAATLQECAEEAEKKRLLRAKTLKMGYPEEAWRCVTCVLSFQDGDEEARPSCFRRCCNIALGGFRQWANV